MHYEYNTQDPDFTVHNITTVKVNRDNGCRHSYKNGRGKYGFIYVVKGGLLENFLEDDIGDILISTGEVLFIPKGTRYIGIYTQDETEVKIVQFDLLSGTLPEYLLTPTKIDLPNITELMESFFSPSFSHTSDHPFYYLSHMYDLLYQVDEHFSKIPSKYKKLSPAIREISELYNKNEPVAYYAQLCNMSEVNFRRVFGEYFGISPIEYRNEIRLKNAKLLLVSGEYNVSEVAELCGFSNLSFFIRLYKKKYGHTPKKE